MNKNNEIFDYLDTNVGSQHWEAFDVYYAIYINRQFDPHNIGIKVSNNFYICLVI